MDIYNLIPSLPKGELAMDTCDWRAQLPFDSRERIVNKIMETLKKHLPYWGPEGIKELRKIASRFEEKIFSGAANPTDYLRKISMKMLTMETKYQAGSSSSSLPIPGAYKSLPLNPGCHQMTIEGPIKSNAAVNTGHLMDNNNWRLGLPKREPDMDTDDWRTHLPPDSRLKIINNIMEKLMKHLPFSGAEGMNEARTIAATFEDEIFRGAVDQTDYFRKISMKMVTMEIKWQHAADSSSSSLSIPEASKKLPLNPGHLMNTVVSKPSHPRAEAGMNTCDLTTQLPSDSRQNNANTTYTSIQYMTGPSLPSGEPAMTTYDWRTQLKPDSRERIVNNIAEQLQKHLPYSSSEEMRRMAVKFEERIFSSAVNQTGYFRSISMKMLTMETKYQTTAGSSSSSLPFPGAYNSLPLNPGRHKMTIKGPFEAEPAVNTCDWRTCLPPDSRKKNANKIKGTLKKHVPNCGKEGNKELKRIAVSFEELIFNTAISQVDYLRKISFKMQAMNEGD